MPVEQALSLKQDKSEVETTICNGKDACRKVQPFENVEVIFKRESNIFRRGESVIDLEKKKAKEKEDEWRKSKGLVSKDDEKSEKEKTILLEISNNTDERSSHPRKSYDKDGTLRKMASQFLETELLKNKKREEEYLSEGKIKSLSKGIKIRANQGNIDNTKKYIQNENELKFCKILDSKNFFFNLESINKNEEEIKKIQNDRKSLNSPKYQNASIDHKVNNTDENSLTKNGNPALKVNSNFSETHKPVEDSIITKEYFLRPGLFTRILRQDDVFSIIQKDIEECSRRDSDLKIQRIQSVQ